MRRERPGLPGGSAVNRFMEENHGPRPYDAVIAEIAEYATRDQPLSTLAYATARWSLADALGSAMLALRHPSCQRLLGGLVPGVSVSRGARVPGTHFELDPIEASFNLATMIRWLDYNDTWLDREWGHPSDNVGAILMVADWISRQGSQPALTMQDVLTAMIKAHEIQGVLSMSVALNRVGYDHVWWVKVASTAVVTAMLGGDREAVARALSHAWIDGGSLRSYRHAPDTGSRKSWAAGDAASRAVRLSLIALRGEMGYPCALTAPTWGFQDVVLHGDTVRLARPLGNYVMENILFKVAYPAEFHGQTAIECALRLYPLVRARLDEIETIHIETQESAMRIINKTGPLANPADRDHCLQFMVAAALATGHLDDESYSQRTAEAPRIDALRACMTVEENPAFSRAYLDPGRRAIANAITIRFKDGTTTPRVEVEYPLGHRRRRTEALPLLGKKFRHNVSSRFSGQQRERLLALFDAGDAWDAMPVPDFVQLWIPPEEPEAGA